MDTGADTTDGTVDKLCRQVMEKNEQHNFTFCTGAAH